MAIAYGVRLALDPLRSLYYTELSTSSYAAMQTFPDSPGGPAAPFENVVRMLSISNNTDEDILVSLDAINPHIYVAANGFVMRDYCANQDSINGLAGLPIGVQLSVVSLNAPTSGYVFAEVTYVTNQASF